LFFLVRFLCFFVRGPRPLVPTCSHSLFFARRNFVSQPPSSTLLLFFYLAPGALRSSPVPLIFFFSFSSFQLSFFCLHLSPWAFGGPGGPHLFFPAERGFFRTVLRWALFSTLLTTSSPFFFSASSVLKIFSCLLLHRSEKFLRRYNKPNGPLARSLTPAPFFFAHFFGFSHR